MINMYKRLVFLFAVEIRNKSLNDETSSNQKI